MEKKTEARPPMAKAYEPQGVEPALYAYWMQHGYFTPRIDPAKKPFVIIMPPPNVTGELHLGHALTAAIEDIMIRWHRMKGDPSLWLPGSDHAGIATQNVVEKDLAKEGLSRHDLGREAFIKRVWQWKEKYGNIITEQHKRLGASCDWTRECFTMDPGPAKAVRTTFANLFRRGLIYRGERIINWCPRCATALSDLEVEHEDLQSHLYFVRYRVLPLDRSNVPTEDEYITVATTRPETILGDTAVAINPQDARYTALIGREAMLPEIGRIIPIVADEAVDPTFGTGAVKVTPAHDPVDFEIGQRHGLPSVTVINLDGTMNENAGRYAGLDRFACRQALLDDLRRDGLLVKIEPHLHAVGHCSRCRTIVEPLLSAQWFVKIQPLAAPAIEAVVSGKIKIIPERFTKVYLNWMENIRDWCISRQLWWGHRIPVWYCQNCGEVISAVEDPTVCPRCTSDRLEQDPDVLDTWFSSGLWPHSTLGWPDDTVDLRYFYPSSVMETGYDILFFWVARMIMMGLANTGEVPFHTVYLHGLVRDEKGEKMSKSKGNVLNPLDLVEQYGADALRFALSTGSTPGNDMKLSLQKVEAGRNFANKLWNVARFVITTLAAEREASRAATASPSFVVSASSLAGSTEVPTTNILASDLTLADRWIVSRAHAVSHAVNQLIADFQFGEAGRQIHDFIWSEFADWYIEIAKIQLRGSAEIGRRRACLATLVEVLHISLRLLHPFMPFVTEEIWRNLFGELKGREPSPEEALIVAPYPEADPARIDPVAEQQMGLIIDIVRAIRNARAEQGVEPGRWIEATIVAGEAESLLRSQEHIVAAPSMARINPLQIVGTGGSRTAPTAEKPQQALALVVQGLEIYLPLAGMIDLTAEKHRLEREIASALSEIGRLEGKLAKPDFVAKAPEAVVVKERSRLAEQREKLEKLEQRLKTLL